MVKSIKNQVNEFEQFKSNSIKFREHAEADGHRADEEAKDSQNALRKAGFDEEVC